MGDGCRWVLATVILSNVRESLSSTNFCRCVNPSPLPRVAVNPLQEAAPHILNPGFTSSGNISGLWCVVVLWGDHACTNRTLHLRLARRLLVPPANRSYPTVSSDHLWKWVMVECAVWANSGEHMGQLAASSGNTGPWQDWNIDRVAEICK